MNRYCDLCDTERPVSRVLTNVADNEHVVDRTFDIVSCDHCGHCFLEPQPVDQAEVAGYYPTQYYAHSFSAPYTGTLRLALKTRLRDIYYRKARGDSVPGLADNALYMLLKRTVNEPPFVPGGQLLDIGCGSCEYLVGLEGTGWERYGVEPSERSVEEACAHGLRVRQGTAEATGYEDGAFDVVRMWNVLEHTCSPSAALEETRRLLKEGGYLMLFVPNFASYERRMFGRYWMSLEVPRHLHHFLPDALEAYLEKHGFHVERRLYPGTLVSTLAPTLRIMKEDGVHIGSRLARTILVLLCKCVRRMWGDYSHDSGLAVLARRRPGG